jgi:copper chaperone
MPNSLNLKIDGMHCDACVRRVTAVLSQVPGVEVKNVQVGSAAVAFDPAKASPVTIAQAINKIGFTATPES